jgi:hypothetical protein
MRCGGPSSCPSRKTVDIGKVRAAGVHYRSMVSRRRRRQEARDLFQGFKELPPEQAGLIMVVLGSNALISVALQIVLLATYARAARRAFRVRHNGTRMMAHAALTRPVITLTCGYGIHLICTSRLPLRWVRHAVRRAESDTQPHEDQRSSA